MQQLVDNVTCNMDTLLSWMHHVWCLFLFQVVWQMHKQIGRQTAADLVSFKVKGRFLSRGKWGTFKFIWSDNDRVRIFKLSTGIHYLTCETNSLLRGC